MKKRIEWIDIAKAIGIIAVVIGHFAPKDTTFYASIYWWHMPLFFIIGGFFVKPLQLQELPEFWRRKIWPQLKEYFGYGLALITLSFVVEQHTWQFSLHYIWRLLYGGTLLTGYLSAFWFMTVYLGSLILVSLVKGYAQPVGMQAVIMLWLFILGTSYQNATVQFGRALPGNLDLVLLAAPYMFTGWCFFHYARKLLQNAAFGLIPLGLFMILYRLQYSGRLNFLLYLKSHHITHPLMALVVPVILAVGIFAFSKGLALFRIGRLLGALGRSTLPIMYLHKAVGYLLEKITQPHLLLWVIAGVLLPFCMIQLWQYLKTQWSSHEKYALD